MPSDRRGTPPCATGRADGSASSGQPPKLPLHWYSAKSVSWELQTKQHMSGLAAAQAMQQTSKMSSDKLQHPSQHTGCLQPALFLIAPERAQVQVLFEFVLHQKNPCEDAFLKKQKSVVRIFQQVAFTHTIHTILVSEVVEKVDIVLSCIV